MKIAIISNSFLFRLGLKEFFLSNPNFSTTFYSFQDPLSPSLFSDNALNTILIHGKIDEALENLVTQLKQTPLSIPICLITPQILLQEIPKWLALGVAGFVSEDILEKGLLDTLIKITQGERFFDSLLLNSSFGILHQPPVTDTLVMTKREKEIFNLTAQGKTACEIGGTLYISPRTVEKHQENLRKKMEVANKVCMLRQAQCF